MTDEQWRTAWKVFDSACLLPPNQRREYVQTAAPENETAETLLRMLDEMDTPEPAASGEPRDPQATDPTNWIGATIGRFVITAFVGQGGMGQVFSAVDPELNRPVAIKILSPHIAGSLTAVEPFVREAQAASALNHPNIVTIHEVVRSESVLAIVMELVAGSPLRAMCGVPNPVNNVASWGRQIAHALAEAHAHGIIHSDIKPENLMLRPDGYVKVLDFGLARQITASNEAGEPAAGTLGYMSPDQILGPSMGRPLTTATDVFSLGVVLYELASGTNPFAGESTPVTTRLITSRDPPALSASCKAIPMELDRLVRTMLSKEPNARPTAAEVARQLESLPQDKRTRRLAMVVAAIVVMAAIAAFAVRMHFFPAQQEVTEVPGTLFTGAPGREGQPAFSPDGKWLAYAWDGGSGGKRDIYARRLDGGDPVRLSIVPEDEWDPSWSPDGANIAFLRLKSSDIEVVTVPASGGAEHILTTISPVQNNIHQRLTWVSRSDLIVADVSPGYAVGFQLYRISVLSGSRNLLLAPREAREGTDFAPRVSPDGRWIAFVRNLLRTMELRIVSASGGDSRLLATESRVQSLAWARDSEKIYYYSFRAAGLNDLSQVSVLGGASTRAPIAFEAGSTDLALSADGHSAAYVKNIRDTNLWKVFADGRAPQEVIASTRADEDGALSPDESKIAFSSDRTGLYEIWVADDNGLNQRRLTSFNGFSGSPVWSPDGSRLAFDSNIGGLTRVLTVALDGGSAPKEVSDPTFDAWLPSWSRDGRWIYFCSHKTGSNEIWRVPSGGGVPVRITSGDGSESKESPDGKYLYYAKGEKKDIWRMPLGTPGAAEERFAALDPSSQFRCWDVGASGVYLAPSGGRPRIERLPFSGGPAELSAFLPADLPDSGRCFAVSSDERTFLYPILESDRQEIYVAALPSR